MSPEQLQLLAAAVIDSVARGPRNYTGLPDAVRDSVNSNWNADFTEDAVREALTILARLGGVQLSSTTRLIKIDADRARSGAGSPGTPGRFEPRKAFPLLYEYSHFGHDWLEAVWNQYFPAGPAGHQSDQPQLAQLSEGATFESSEWTGIRNAVITAANKGEIQNKIDEAINLLDQHDLTNTQKQQAAVLLTAARDLIEAPEPPSTVIWDLIARAADVTGLIGFFLALFAVFSG